MKKRILYLLVGSLLLTTSCQDFLEKNSVNSIGQAEAIRNLKDAEAAINGIYATWNSDGLYSGYLTLLPDIQCDFTYSVVGYSNKLGNVYGWNHIPTNEYTKLVYASLYKVISDVNFLLENEENVKLKAGEEKAFRNILGEAYFSRALAYTELAKLFCEVYDPDKADTQMGVAIWNTFDVGKPARSSLAQTYKQIFEDLKHADEYLTSEAEADAVRITRGALDALYARLYLYQQNWEEAAKAATRVIDNPHYALASGYTGQSPVAALTEFNTMWEFDHSDEIIWKLKYTTNNIPGFLGYIFCGTVADQLHIDYAPSVEILDMYTDNDIRQSVYFAKGKVNGSLIPIIIKYPGNPDLRPSTVHVFCNMPKIFRLGEMYLIRAEAYAKSRHENEANADLKTLRTKRIDGYTHTIANGNLLLEGIRKERIKELYMEGHRLYDLRRYGEGFKRKKQSQSISPEDQLSITPSNPRFIWPIPSHEMDANRNMKQNPGY